MVAKDTAGRLLDTAQQLVQSRGFNAFSYKDLAQAIGIRTASIHYHFPSKAHLGTALLERYLADLEVTLAQLEAAGGTYTARLQGFIAAYESTEQKGAICLSGSMASDLETLPEPMRPQVQAYLDRSERWVRAQIEAGAKSGEFGPAALPEDIAATLLAGLQGALLIARARDGRSVLRSIERTLMMSLGVA